MVRTEMRSATVVLVGAIATMVLTACSNAGDLSVVNNGPGDVTVDTGDADIVVEADGGTVLLDYGCTPGDVTITFATGSETVLPGPICAEEEIVIGNGAATLQPAQNSTQ